MHCSCICTVFARLAGPGSNVYGIDYIDPLVQLSERNINADDKDLIASGKIKLYTKDGWQGLPDEAPFDAIHVGAAAATVPKELVSARSTHTIGMLPDTLWWRISITTFI
jgi:protein-L-isoaspartate O-methyltransferase